MLLREKWKANIEATIVIVILIVAEITIGDFSVDGRRELYTWLRKGGS
jgi:hypothetical protein